MVEGHEELIRLSLSYAWGPQVGMLRWTKPHTLVYPIGKHICVHNVENHEDSSMHFTKDTLKLKNISCIDVHPDGLLAIGATMVSKNAAIQIAVVDTNMRCKVLSIIEQQIAAEFISVAFDPSGTYIVCISRDVVEYKLHVVDWQQSKFLTKLSFFEAISKARFNPCDAQKIILSGAGCAGLQLYEMDDRGKDLTLTLFSRIDTREEEYISDFHWIDDASVVALAKLGVLVVNMLSSCILQTLDLRDFTLRCIIVLPQGVLLGGSGGYVSFWRKVDSSSIDGQVYFRESKTQQISAADIATMDVMDTLIALGFEDRNIGFMTLSSFFNAREGDECALKLLHNGVHSDKIVGVDISVQHNICITCSIDKSIRVWNLQSKQCDMCRTFQDAPLSVVLHPFGFLAAAIFPDMICFFYLDGEIRTGKEIFERDASMLRYSREGEHIAVAYQNGQILIVNARTFDKYGMLQGHENRVNALCFSEDDKFLASGDKDGTFRVWCMESMQCVFELCSWNAEYLSIAYAPDEGGRWVCAAQTASGRVLRIWDSMRVPSDLPLPDNVTISSLDVMKDALGRCTLLAATHHGALRLCAVAVKETKSDEYALHAHDGDNAIFHMALAGNMLVTAGYDGSMHLLKCTELDSALWSGSIPSDTTDQSTVHSEPHGSLHAGISVHARAGIVTDSVAMLEEAVRRDVPYASSFVIHDMPCNLTPRTLMEFFDSHNLRCGEDVDFFHVSTRRILRKRKFCFVHCTSLAAAMRLCSLHGKVLFPDEPHSRACRIEINRKLPTLRAVWEDYRQHGRRSSAVFWPCETSFDCFSVSGEDSV